MSNSVNAAQYTGFSSFSIGSTNIFPFSSLTGTHSPTIAYGSFEASSVRIRMDGVSAHSASGHLITGGTTITFVGSDVITKLALICPNGSGTAHFSLGKI